MIIFRSLLTTFEAKGAIAKIGSNLKSSIAITYLTIKRIYGIPLQLFWCMNGFEIFDRNFSLQY